MSASVWNGIKAFGNFLSRNRTGVFFGTMITGGTIGNAQSFSKQKVAQCNINNAINDINKATNSYRKTWDKICCAEQIELGNLTNELAANQEQISHFHKILSKNLDLYKIEKNTQIITSTIIISTVFILLLIKYIVSQSRDKYIQTAIHEMHKNQKLPWQKNGKGMKKPSPPKVKSSSAQKDNLFNEVGQLFD
jgi:hypothetical protein